VTRPCRGDHTDAAVCWRCSDAVPWWREARLAAGIPEPAPRHPPIPVRAGPPRKGMVFCCVCRKRVRPGSERLKVALLRGRDRLGNGRIQASLHRECWAELQRALAAIACGMAP
jgi:hypothetical protein